MATNKNWASWMKSKIASERQQDDKTAQSTAFFKSKLFTEDRERRGKDIHINGHE